MTKPLAGQRWVVTRPREQSAGLVRALQAQGAQVIELPLLAITPLADPAPLLALATRLEAFSLAFFVSPNAVEHALAVLGRAIWPAHLAVATVGPASAQALRAHGFAQVIVPTERFDSEAVLALPAFQTDAVAGRQVLVLRGDGGRELLADTLRARGAQVEQVCCYQRSCARTDPAPLIDCFDAGGLDGVIFSSSESVACFTDIVGSATPTILGEVPVYAPHARIVASLQQAGARRAILTGAGDEGIVSAILARLANP